ncbi:teichuronic acid biosynthesis protein TuaE [Niallia sp. MER TA 168]|uniref:teichuronic acid biosynthesis protein TuaE n=1 Tax=Niallia sp. MER TA 168 TaxID=2939568 RepID=UPI00203AE7FB|nr:O-antigen ligase family protein [Niallia sp. MER TA 168]MCM3361412.1 O-antigen ligase family protein [Niallia sp. MER TA 168]
MGNNRTVSKTIGFTVLFIGCLTVLYVTTMYKLTWILPIVSIWISIQLGVYLKSVMTLDQLFRKVMYALLLSTFLNQSVISVNVGAFSLFLYRILLLLAIILYVCTALYDKRLVVDFTRSGLSFIWLFFGGWILYGMISVLWSISIIASIKYLSLLMMGIAFVYLASMTFKTRQQLKFFLAGWLGMTVLLVGIGFVNYFFSIQLPSSGLYGASIHKLSYPTAVFFNQNDFAVYLGISFFFFLAVAKNAKKTMLKGSTFLLSVMVLILLYLTESRAAMLAVIGGGLVYLFLLIPKRWKKLMLLTLFGLFVLGSLLFANRGIAKVHLLMDSAGEYGFDEVLPSNLARINLLRNTFYYLLDSYGFGIGAGNIPYYLEHESYFPTGNVYQVHNWFAEIAGNFGLVILLGYLFVWIYTFIRFYRIYQRSNSRTDKMLLEASMIGMVSFLISSISPSSVMNLYFHWVFLGFILSTLSVYKNRKLES